MGERELRCHGRDVVMADRYQFPSARKKPRRTDEASSSRVGPEVYDDGKCIFIFVYDSGLGGQQGRPAPLLIPKGRRVRMDLHLHRRPTQHGGIHGDVLYYRHHRGIVRRKVRILGLIIGTVAFGRRLYFRRRVLGVAPRGRCRRRI